MYDLIDRPVTELDYGGRFLVWAMRSWVKAAGDQVCPASSLARAFDRWRMLAGLQPFLRVMALFNRHGLEHFAFCPLACNHVSEHEAIIIGLVCALADERPQAVCKTLELLVEEEAVGDLLLALSSLGRAMDGARIFPGRPAGGSGAMPCGGRPASSA